MDMTGQALAGESTEDDAKVQVGFSATRVTMWAAVPDFKAAATNLQLDLSASWQNDPLNANPRNQLQHMARDGVSDGPTNERVNYYVLKKFLKMVQTVRVTALSDMRNGSNADATPYENSVDGAPVTFVRTLMSENASRIVRCIGQPFSSDFKDADCQYFDTGMFLAVWGILIMPPLILLISVLFLIGRHIREISCSPTDRSVPLSRKLRMYSCNECGGREPTELYTPSKQICYFVTMLVLCFFVSFCAVLAMVSGEHWEAAVLKAAAGVNATLTVESTLRSHYKTRVAGMQEEAVTFFLLKNTLFDQVAVYVKDDLPKLREGLHKLRNQMRLVTVFVEGCTAAIPPEYCDIRNSSVMQHHNKCLRTTFPVFNSTNSKQIIANRTEWVHPPGHAMRYPGRDGVTGNNPACEATGVCPCCELCSEILENIDAQLLSIEDSQRIAKELSNHWVRDEVAQSIAHAAEPLSQPLTLLGTVAKEFVEAVAGFRKLEQDSRLLRKVFNYVGWGSVVLALFFLPVSVISGSAAFNSCGLLWCFLALELCWLWWAVMGIVMVPHGDLCSIVLPEPVGNMTQTTEYQQKLPLVMGANGVEVVRRRESDFLFFAAHMEPGNKYYQGDEREHWIEGRPGLSRQNASDFRKFFDSCMLDPTSVVWEAMSYPKANFQNKSFDKWGVYDRVKKGNMEKWLHLSQRLGPLKSNVAEFMAMPIDEKLGYNVTCAAAATCVLRAQYASYTLRLNEYLSTARMEVTHWQVAIGEKEFR